VSHLYFKFKGKRCEHFPGTIHEWVARIKADAEIMAIKARAQEQESLERFHPTAGS
jgi:ribosomal protein L16/L10AE